MKPFRLLAAEQPAMLLDVPKPKAGSGQVVIEEGGAMTWTALLDKRLLRLLPLGATALLGGCKVVVLDPKGQIGADERSIIMTATMLMLLVVVPVIMMVFAFAWRYRASNPRAQYAPDWDHSYKIAPVISLVTCMIVLWLGILAWQTSHRLDPYRPLASSATPITIDVVALDWKWLFIYPDLHIATINEIAFPANVATETGRRSEIAPVVSKHHS